MNGDIRLIPISSTIELNKNKKIINGSLNKSLDDMNNTLLKYSFSEFSFLKITKPRDQKLKNVENNCKLHFNQIVNSCFLQWGAKHGVWI